MVLSPLVVALLAAITIDLIVSRRDRGGLFYREPRISRGRLFGLLKFRTLRRDALERMRSAGGHARLYEADPDNLTWTGRRLLKPWYLDELPQLLNVLLGDLSLVQPGQLWVTRAGVYVDRLACAWMLQRFVDPEARFLFVAPDAGIPGEGIPYEDLDSLYLERCSTLSGWSLVRYDLQILWRTLVVMARGEGLNY